GETRFKWLVGVFYSDADRDYHQRLPTPGYDAVLDAAAAIRNADANPNNNLPTASQVDNGFGLVDQPYHADLPYNDKQIAIFGEASYDITDRATVTVGGRYYDFDEERRFHSGGLFSNTDDQTDKTDSNGFSPRVLVSYRASDALIWNAQISKGFRLGG